MKLKILVLLFSVTVTVTKAQQMTPADSARYLLDTTIRIMKKKAFLSDQVNWASLQKNLFAEVSHVRSVKEAGFAFTRLFDELQDVHGIFYYKDSFFRSNKKPKNEGLINEATMAALKQGPKVIPAMLYPDIAYLNIPFISQQDVAAVNQVANRINDSLVNLLHKNPRGVIIDLRLNQGGNMYPMIAGLHSLFNNGPVSGEYSFEWKDKGNATYFYQDSLISDYYRIGIKHPEKHVSIPVAILIGPSTASAGECVAAAFTFRDKSILVGEESMGLTTSNDGFMLIPPDIGFNLSVGVIKDGKGNKLTGAIKPQLVVNGGDDFTNRLSDKKVVAAIAWIRNF